MYKGELTIESAIPFKTDSETKVKAIKVAAYGTTGEDVTNKLDAYLRNLIIMFGPNTQKPLASGLFDTLSNLRKRMVTNIDNAEYTIVCFIGADDAKYDVVL